jgi:putative NIF3 family GTP cyclohydrolase 1 type 2
MMKVNSISRDELAQFLETELQLARVRDYCPNGVQVEGRNEIKRIVTGVTASLALLNKAVSRRLTQHWYIMAISGAARICASSGRNKALKTFAAT